MSMEDFYEVGNTGMYFGNGHKGGFTIIVKENKFFYMDWRIEGSCDCIKGIYEAIKDLVPFNEEHEDSFILRYEWLIRETAKKVWDSDVDYAFPKCCDCTLKKNRSKRNGCVWWNTWDWYESDDVETDYPPFDLLGIYERVDTMLRAGY